MAVDHGGAGVISLSIAADGTAAGDAFRYAERITDEHRYAIANLDVDADGITHTPPHAHAHLHADTCAAACPSCAARL